MSGLVPARSSRAIWYWSVSPITQIEQGLTRLDEGVLRRSLFEHTGGSYPEVCEADCLFICQESC